MCKEKEVYAPKSVGGDNHRERKSRQGVGDVCPKQRKTQGNGGSKRAPFCKHCKQKGHRSSDCVNVTGSATEAANRLEEKSVDEPPVPEKSPEEINSDKVWRLYRMLLCKAVSMLMTKDLNSQSDRKVVMRAIVNLAHMENVQSLTLPYSFGHWLAYIFNTALVEAFEARKELALAATLEVVPMPHMDVWELYESVMKLLPHPSTEETPQFINQFDDYDDQVKCLERVEAMPLWSRRSGKWMPSEYTYIYRFFVLIRIAVGCYFEDWLRMSGLIFWWATDYEGDVFFESMFFVIFAFSPFYVSILYAMMERDGHILTPVQSAISYKGGNYWYALFGHTLNLAVYGTCAIVLWGLDLHLYYIRGTSWQVMWIFHVCMNMYHYLIGWPLHDIWANLKVRYDLCLEGFRVKKVDVQPEHTCKEGEPVCNVKFGTRTFFSVEGIRPIIHRQCTHNERISLSSRVFKLLPVHSRLAEVLGRWRKLAKQYVPILAKKIGKVDKPVRLGKWFSSFPPAKRERLRMVYRNVIRFFRNTLISAKSFMKREVMLRFKDSFGVKVEKDPRMIQGGPEEISILVGPTMRKFSKALREGLMPDFTPVGVRSGKQIVYVCGLSGEAIGHAFNSAIKCIESMCIPGETVVFIEDDESRFDQHIIQGPFEYLNKLYGRVLPHRVSRLLKRTNKSRGRTCLGTKYSVPYTMQSGMPDTSCGTTSVNTILKFNAHGLGRKWISIINGDDSVTITTDRELKIRGGLPGLEKSYVDLGMEVEMFLRQSPLDVEFCSGRFYPSKKGYVFMPKPGKMIAKLGHDMVNRPNREWAPWLRGIANTCLSFGRYDPLLRTLGNALVRCAGEGRAMIGDFSEYKKFVDQSDECSSENILDYYSHHYGFCERDILNVQRHIQFDFSVGIEFTDPLLVALCEKDTV